MKMKRTHTFSSDNLSSKDNKKLINFNINIKRNIIHNKEMSDYENQKVELSNNVSNKEALKNKIHEIHNYLRNNGAGYGMNALKVFNLLYGLKKIEEANLLDKVNLKRPDCEFSYLLKIANENKDELLTELILGSLSTSIYNSNICKLLFYKIPSNIKSFVFAHLIKEVEKITVIEKTCNVLLSGKIYEYFIGRDELAISELGAYFTDRHIVDYIYKKLDPELNEDGSINTMIDMFGGSGGFTTGYINYLNDKYDNINWTNNIDKVYHFDMNEDVIKSAGLEFFCLTRVLPNMNDNLKYMNSFTDEFNSKKFMNVITNPPYGGDKKSQSDTQIKRKKIKEHIKKELLVLKDELKIKTRLRQIKKIEDQEKQEKKDCDKKKVSVEMCSQRIIKYAKDNKLTGNDKESSSLILIMDMVDINGTAIGVLKEGVFFNKTYKDIRKCLVENFNVLEIISVPQDQFENTSTKTSIVIFKNTEEKTTKVIFSDLVVEKYTEDKFEEIGDEIVLSENKDDIYGISDKLVSEASKDEILKNNICSLNGKDYKLNNIVVGDEYELVKLGVICTFLAKSKRNASFGQPIGKYNFYTSSNKVQKCDIADYAEECLIIGSGGVANIKIDNIFSCSADNIILKSLSNKYLYNLLKGNMNLLSDGFNGSTLKHLSKDYLTNLKVPVPKSKQKITEWVNKISKPYDKKNENKELIMKLEEDIRNKIKDIEDNEDCDEVELGSICNFVSGKKRNTTDGKPTGLYPLFSSSLNVDNWIDTFDYNEECIIINTINSSGKFNLQYANKFCSTSNTIIFNTGNTNLTLYIYYFGLKNIETLSNLANGSTKKKMGKSEISKFILKIPKNKKLINNFEPLFKEIEKLQSEMKEADLQYKQLIKELSEEAIPSNKKIEVKSDNELLEELNENIINVKEPVIETSEKKSKNTKNNLKTK